MSPVITFGLAFSIDIGRDHSGAFDVPVNAGGRGCFGSDGVCDGAKLCRGIYLVPRESNLLCHGLSASRRSGTSTQHPTSRHQRGHGELGRNCRRACLLFVGKGLCAHQRGRSKMTRFGLDRSRITVHCGTAREPILSKESKA